VAARLQEFLFDGIGREILVAFDNDSGVAFGDDFSAPERFGHVLRLRRRRIAFAQDIAGPRNLSK
jgi:hypothetical protein